MTMASLLQYSTLVLALALPALTSPLLEDRAVCNRNNLVRCFDPTGTNAKDIASRSAATAFCSSYLSVPIVTSIIATTTPATTVTSTVTTTDKTEVLTSLTTETGIVTTTSTSTLTLPYVLVPSPVAVPGKRGASVAPPVCAGTNNAPSALSSACACIQVVPSTTYITATGPTSTKTETSIIQETTTTTTAITVSTETTTTESATATTTKPPPTCAAAYTPITASNGRLACSSSNSRWETRPGISENVPSSTNSLSACVEQCVGPVYGPKGCVAVNWNSYAGASGLTYDCTILYALEGSAFQMYSYAAFLR